MKPKEDTGRCNKIIYFNDNTKIPYGLDTVGEKKQRIGYGFYGFNEQLQDDIANTSPNFEVYLPWLDKLSAKTVYNKMTRSSYIRLETNNFGGYIKSQTIFLADNNFFSIENSVDFLREKFKKHDFYFIHRPKINDLNIAAEVCKFTPLFNKKPFCNFDFNWDFLKEYVNDFDFTFKKKENESLSLYEERILKMGIYFKQNNKQQWIVNTSENTPFIKLIKKWIQSPTIESMKDFFNSDAAAQKMIESQSAQIRLFAKLPPRQINQSSLGLDKLLIY